MNFDDAIITSTFKYKNEPTFIISPRYMYVFIVWKK